MVHERSTRKDKAFKILHCSSVTENLLEAELLGYEKGAFAGAYSTKQGLVEQCAGGTLYLKEIGDLSLSMQLKILKIIEDQTYTRLGGTEILKSNVRIIVSTGRNLRKLITLGTFREDLFFRLNVVELELPPLRQRREDIALLAEHFLRQFCTQMKKDGIQWKEEALNRLQSHGFPGNVRELKNEVERIVAIKESHSFIETTDLSSKVMESLSPIEEIEKGRTLKDIIDTYEKKIISEALGKYHWNKSRVAELFQITRQGLMKKITKHRLDKRKNI
jgi:DNA-binding NtrC family response regulator